MKVYLRKYVCVRPTYFSRSSLAKGEVAFAVCTDKVVRTTKYIGLSSRLKHEYTNISLFAVFLQEIKCFDVVKGLGQLLDTTNPFDPAAFLR